MIYMDSSLSPSEKNKNKIVGSFENVERGMIWYTYNFQFYNCVKGTIIVHYL